jgi:hypothetical protein
MGQIRQRSAHEEAVRGPARLAMSNEVFVPSRRLAGVTADKSAAWRSSTIQCERLKHHPDFEAGADESD